MPERASSAPWGRTRRRGAYLGRKLDACRAGQLQLVVGHVDVLALPPGPPGGRPPPVAVAYPA